MMRIPISEVKRIRESLGMTHLVIFAVDKEGNQHVATHGETQINAREAARAGNNLKISLGWPDDLCRDKPLPRIHKNCAYFKPDYGIHCFNGWSDDGSRGYCYVEPTTTGRFEGEEIACRYFEPKG